MSQPAAWEEEPSSGQPSSGQPSSAEFSTLGLTPSQQTQQLAGASFT